MNRYLPSSNLADLTSASVSQQEDAQVRQRIATEGPGLSYDSALIELRQSNINADINTKAKSLNMGPMDLAYLEWKKATQDTSSPFYGQDPQTFAKNVKALGSNRYDLLDASKPVRGLMQLGNFFDNEFRATGISAFAGDAAYETVRPFTDDAATLAAVEGMGEEMPASMANLLPLALGTVLTGGGALVGAAALTGLDAYTDSRETGRDAGSSAGAGALAALSVGVMPTTGRFFEKVGADTAIKLAGNSAAAAAASLRTGVLNTALRTTVREVGQVGAGSVFDAADVVLFDDNRTLADLTKAEYLVPMLLSNGMMVLGQEAMTAGSNSLRNRLSKVPPQLPGVTNVLAERKRLADQQADWATRAPIAQSIEQQDQIRSFGEFERLYDEQLMSHYYSDGDMQTAAAHQVAATFDANKLSPWSLQPEQKTGDFLYRMAQVALELKVPYSSLAKVSSSAFNTMRSRVDSDAAAALRALNIMEAKSVRLYKDIPDDLRNDPHAAKVWQIHKQQIKRGVAQMVYTDKANGIAAVALDTFVGSKAPRVAVYKNGARVTEAEAANVMAAHGDGIAIGLKSYQDVTRDLYLNARNQGGVKTGKDVKPEIALMVGDTLKGLGIDMPVHLITDSDLKLPEYAGVKAHFTPDKFGSMLQFGYDKERVALIWTRDGQGKAGINTLMHEVGHIVETHFREKNVGALESLKQAAGVAFAKLDMTSMEEIRKMGPNHPEFLKAAKKLRGKNVLKYDFPEWFANQFSKWSLDPTARPANVMEKYISQTVAALRAMWDKMQSFVTGRVKNAADASKPDPMFNQWMNHMSRKFYMNIMWDSDTVFRGLTETYQMGDAATDALGAALYAKPEPGFQKLISQRLADWHMNGRKLDPRLVISRAMDDFKSVEGIAHLMPERPELADSLQVTAMMFDPAKLGVSQTLINNVIGAFSESNARSAWIDEYSLASTVRTLISRWTAGELPGQKGTPLKGGESLLWTHIDKSIKSLAKPIPADMTLKANGEVDNLGSARQLMAKDEAETLIKGFQSMAKYEMYQMEAQVDKSGKYFVAFKYSPDARKVMFDEEYHNSEMDDDVALAVDDVMQDMALKAMEKKAAKRKGTEWSSEELAMMVPGKVKFAAEPTDAVHYGDGGIGHDTQLRRMDGGRGTGHFGTGTYFLSGKESPLAREGRPAKHLDLTGLSMAKPGGSARQLHDALRIVNGAIIRGTKLEFTEPRHDGKKATFNIALALGLHLHPEAVVRDSIQNTARIFSEGKNDGIRTPATYVMQDLGYDGIDVRGTDLDNGDYGSVIFADAQPFHSVVMDMAFTNFAGALPKDIVIDLGRLGLYTPTEFSTRMGKAIAKSIGAKTAPEPLLRALDKVKKVSESDLEFYTDMKSVGKELGFAGDTIDGFVGAVVNKLTKGESIKELALLAPEPLAGLMRELGSTVDQYGRVTEMGARMGAILGYHEQSLEQLKDARAKGIELLTSDQATQKLAELVQFASEGGAQTRLEKLSRSAGWARRVLEASITPFTQIAANNPILAPFDEAVHMESRDQFRMMNDTMIPIHSDDPHNLNFVGDEGKTFKAIRSDAKLNDALDEIVRLENFKKSSFEDLLTAKDPEAMQLLGTVDQTKLPLLEDMRNRMRIVQQHNIQLRALETRQLDRINLATFLTRQLPTMPPKQSQAFVDTMYNTPVGDLPAVLKQSGIDPNLAGRLVEYKNTLDNATTVLIDQMQQAPWYVSEQRMGRFLVRYFDPVSKRSGATSFDDVTEANAWVKANKSAVTISKHGINGVEDQQLKYKTKLSNDFREVLDSTIKAKQSIISTMFDGDENLVKQLNSVLSDVFQGVDSAAVAATKGTMSINRKFSAGRETLDMLDQQRESIRRATVGLTRARTNALYSLYSQDQHFQTTEGSRQRQLAYQHLENARVPDTQTGSTLNKFSFTMTMGLNISSMITEAATVPLVLAPLLRERGASFVESFGLTKRVGAEITKALLFNDGKFNDPDWNKVIDRAKRENALTARHLVDIDSDRVLNDLNSNRVIEGNRVTRPIMSVAEWMYKISSKMYQPAAMASGMTTILAGFEQARSSNPKGNFDEWYAKALNLHTVAQGAGGKAARPVGFFATNGAARTLSQVAYNLQGFSNMQVSNLIHYAKKGWMDDPQWTPQERKQARSAFKLAMGLSIATVGIAGIPLAKAIAIVMEKTFGYNPEKELEKWVYDHAPGDETEKSFITNFAMRGSAYASGLPFDLQSRMTVGGLFALNNYDGFNASNAFGVPGNFALEAMQAMGAGIRGQGFSEMVDLAPAGLRRAAQMWANDGKIVRNGQVMLEPNAIEGAFAAMGFTPSRLKKGYDMNSAKEYFAKQSTADRKNAVTHATNLLNEGKTQEARAYIEEQANKLAGITGPGAAKKELTANIARQFASLNTPMARDPGQTSQAPMLESIYGGGVQPSQTQLYLREQQAKLLMGEVPGFSSRRYQQAAMADDLMASNANLSPVLAQTYARVYNQNVLPNPLAGVGMLVE